MQVKKKILEIWKWNLNKLKKQKIKIYKKQINLKML